MLRSGLRRVVCRLGACRGSEAVEYAVILGVVVVVLAVTLIKLSAALNVRLQQLVSALGLAS